MMEKKMQFAPHVMLIDARYLNQISRELSTHFAPVVNRPLPAADLAVLLERIALDAGISADGNDIQVLFVYDGESGKMDACSPADLREEIHETGFQGAPGHFSLSAFSTEEFTTRDNLFLETLMLADEASDQISHLILVPDEGVYGEEVRSYIQKAAKKKEHITLFGMNPPEEQTDYRFDFLGFAILQALGIRADEI